MLYLLLLEDQETVHVVLGVNLAAELDAVGFPSKASVDPDPVWLEVFMTWTENFGGDDEVVSLLLSLYHSSSADS